MYLFESALCSGARVCYYERERVTGFSQPSATCLRNTA